MEEKIEEITTFGINEVMMVEKDLYLLEEEKNYKKNHPKEFQEEKERIQNLLDTIKVFKLVVLQVDNLKEANKYFGLFKRDKYRQVSITTLVFNESEEFSEDEPSEKLAISTVALQKYNIEHNYIDEVTIIIKNLGHYQAEEIHDSLRSDYDQFNLVIYKI